VLSQLYDHRKLQGAHLPCPCFGHAHLSLQDAICNALEDYNAHITHLKDEMKAATQTSEAIRQEIQGLRLRCALIHASLLC
jgi:hypothetical protein